MSSSSFSEVAKILHAKSSSLEQELDKVKTANLEMRTKVEKFIQTLDEVKTTMCANSTTLKCSICYSRGRSHAFIPCGHLVCQSCSRRAQTRTPPRCFTCRSGVDDIIRVYV